MSHTSFLLLLAILSENYMSTIFHTKPYKTDNDRDPHLFVISGEGARILVRL